MTPPRFYRAFKNLEGFCERAGIKIDRETLVRIKGTRKATKRRTREKRRQLPRDPNPPAPPTVESQNIEMETESTFEKLQQGLKDKEAAQGSIRENARNFAEELKTLALNDDPEVNGPIVDALCFEALPTILEKEFGVSFTLEELCQAELTLREVEKERKMVGELAKKNRDERLAIELEWERVKRIPEKGELLEHIGQLQRKIKVLTGNLNEARATYNNYRTVFSGLWSAVFKCRVCSARFASYMESYPEVNAWFFKGDWRREKQKFLES